MKGATGTPGAAGGIGATGPAGTAAVAYFASAVAYWKNASSGACLYFTQIAGQGSGACPAKASTFPVSQRIEVRVTGTGSYCENKAWQVSFRY